RAWLRGRPPRPPCRRGRGTRGGLGSRFERRSSLTSSIHVHKFVRVEQHQRKIRERSRFGRYFRWVQILFKGRRIFLLQEPEGCAGQLAGNLVHDRPPRRFGGWRCPPVKLGLRRQMLLRDRPLSRLGRTAERQQERAFDPAIRTRGFALQTRRERQCHILRELAIEQRKRLRRYS